MTDALSLHEAAAQGDGALVGRLLDGGADPNSRDEDGRAPLFVAATEDVVRCLLGGGADPGIVDPCDNDAMQAIFWNPCQDDAELSGMVAALVDAGVDLERPDESGHTRLFQMCFLGLHRRAVVLIDRGADATATTPEGQTALMAACWRERILEADAEPWQERLIERLVAAGAPVNASMMGGWTALHEAAHGEASNPVAIRALLRHGAEVDPVDGDGATPLMLAAHAGAAECIAVLLEHGADTTIEDAAGRTAVEHARRRVDEWRRTRENSGPSVDPTLAGAEEVLRTLEGRPPCRPCRGR